MKSLFAIASALLFISNVSTKTPKEQLKEAETKLQARIVSKLDAQGIKQLQNLVQVTAFSQLTKMSQMKKQDLTNYVQQVLPTYSLPEVIQDQLNFKLKRLEQTL